MHLGEMVDKSLPLLNKIAGVARSGRRVEEWHEASYTPNFLGNSDS